MCALLCCRASGTWFDMRVTSHVRVRLRILLRHAVLGRSTLDRLDKDPKPAHVSSNLSYDEIKAIVSHRLAWLFAEKGAVYRASEPVYPIPEDLLRSLVNRRPRIILDWCRAFHERCVAAGRILDIKELGTLAPPPLGPLPPIPPPIPVVDRIATAWDEAYQAARVPASFADEELLGLLTVAAQAYAAETGKSLTSAPHKDSMLRLLFETHAGSAGFLIGVTNRAPAAGAFGAQIRRLRQAARGSIPIAVRTEGFPSGATSSKVVTQFTEAHGRTSYLDKPTLRALVAYQQFRPAFAPEQLQAWQRSKLPISSLQRIAEMFSVDRSSSESNSGVTTDPSADKREASPDKSPQSVNPAAVASQVRERADGQSRAASR